DLVVLRIAQVRIDGVRPRHELALHGPEHRPAVGVERAVPVVGRDAAGVDAVAVDARVLAGVHRLEVAAVARLRDVLAVLGQLVDDAGARRQRVPRVWRLDLGERLVAVGARRTPLRAAVALRGDGAVVVRPAEAEVQGDARVGRA